MERVFSEYKLRLNFFQAPAKKKDKRDLPENNKFYCEVCDRGYKNEEKYKEHNDSHVQVSTNAFVLLIVA